MTTFPSPPAFFQLFNRKHPTGKIHVKSGQSVAWALVKRSATHRWDDTWLGSVAPRESLHESPPNFSFHISFFLIHVFIFHFNSPSLFHFFRAHDLLSLPVSNSGPAGIILIDPIQVCLPCNISGSAAMFSQHALTPRTSFLEALPLVQAANCS